jgi:hypothetical protein
MATATVQAVNGAKIQYQPAIPNTPLVGAATTKFKFTFSFETKMFNVFTSDIATQNFTPGYQIVSAAGFIVQSSNTWNFNSNNSATVEFTDFMALTRDTTGVANNNLIPSPTTSGPYTIKFMTLLDVRTATYNPRNVITATDGTFLYYSSYTSPYRTDPLNSNYLTNFPSSVSITQTSGSIVRITSPVLFAANPDFPIRPQKRVSVSYDVPITVSAAESTNLSYIFQVGKPNGKTVNGLPGSTAPFTSVLTDRNSGEFKLSNTRIPQLILDKAKLTAASSNFKTDITASWNPTGTYSSYFFKDPDIYEFAAYVDAYGSPGKNTLPAKGFTVPPNWAGSMEFILVGGSSLGSAYGQWCGVGEQVTTTVELKAGDRIEINYNGDSALDPVGGCQNVILTLIPGPNSSRIGQEFWIAHGAKFGANGTTPLVGYGVAPYYETQKPGVGYSMVGYDPVGGANMTPLGRNGYPITINGVRVKGGIPIITSTDPFNPRSVNGSLYWIRLIPDVTLSRELFAVSPGDWAISATTQAPLVYTSTPPTIPSGFRLINSTLPNYGQGGNIILTLGFILDDSQAGNYIFYYAQNPSTSVQPIVGQLKTTAGSIFDSAVMNINAPDSYSTLTLKTGTSITNFYTQIGGLYNTYFFSTEGAVSKNYVPVINLPDGSRASS